MIFVQRRQKKLLIIFLELRMSFIKITLNARVTHFSKHFFYICKSKKYDIIDNSNIDSSCLSFKGLHLNRRGDAHFAMNLKQKIQGF